MRKILLLGVLTILMTGCSQFNDPAKPCGQYGEQCLYITPINQ